MLFLRNFAAPQFVFALFAALSGRALSKEIKPCIARGTQCCREAGSYPHLSTSEYAPDVIRERLT